MGWNRGHHITNPNNALLQSKYLKQFTMHLQLWFLANHLTRFSHIYETTNSWILLTYMIQLVTILGGFLKLVGFPNNHSIFLLKMWSSLGVCFGGYRFPMWGRWWGHPHRCPHNHNPLLEANKKRLVFGPVLNTCFFFFFPGRDLMRSRFYVFFLLVENQPNHFWRMFNFEKELGQCSIWGVSSCFSPYNYVYIYIYICT